MDVTGVVLLAGLDERSNGSDVTRQRYRLETMFPDWNQNMAGSLLARFQLRRSGEEIGGIFQPGADVGAAILQLWKALHPRRIEVALTPGSVTAVGRFGDDSDQSLPGIHRFEGTAIEQTEQTRAALADSSCLIACGGDGERRTGGALQHLGTQLYLRLLEWTPRQLEIYEAHREHDSQRSTADALGISQPTVSETLRRIEARATAAAEGYFAELVREAVRPTVPA